MAARVTRIMTPNPPPPAVVQFAICVAATLIVVIPVALLVLPN
jgi:hypothetical protein